MINDVENERQLSILRRDNYYTAQEANQLLNEASLIKDAELVLVLTCAIMIFMMQAGFSLLEAGTVSSKNSSYVLLKTLLNTYMGAIIYYLVGYGLANDA